MDTTNTNLDRTAVEAMNKRLVRESVKKVLQDKLPFARTAFINMIIEKIIYLINQEWTPTPEPRKVDAI